MSGRPHVLPRLLLATATRALPRGVSRDRYRREFAAEIYEMGRATQFRYALGVLTHIWSLRVVLVKGVDSAHVPLLCRTNLHHHWRRHTSDEDVAFEVQSLRQGEGPDQAVTHRRERHGGHAGIRERPVTVRNNSLLAVDQS